MDFQQAKKRFKQLKEQFKAGTLTETEFKVQLKDLMVKDEQGDWWMIGYETEKWYRNDGTNWVQADPPTGLSQEPTRISNWAAIIWIMLGFGFGWGIGGASMILSGDLPLVLVIAWVVGWAIGGSATAITLYREHALANWKSVLWITLGWAIAFLIGLAILLAMNSPNPGGTVGLIGGGIGGFVTGIILRNENILSNQKGMLWTTLGWAIGGSFGGAIGFSIGLSIGPAIDIGDLVGLPSGLGIGGVICGGIGGLVTIWQIKQR
jgi:hypothetical protein